MYCYRIVEIENLEPLKIGTQGAQSIYSEPTAEYIPGSTLRGAIIGQLIRRGLFNEETKEDFLLGMEFYNAYPCMDESLYLPKPLHLRMDKHEWREKKAAHNKKLTLYDLFNQEDTKKNHLEYSFIAVEGDALRGKKITKEYRLHHSTQKDQGKENWENLFRYQAISKEQHFKGIIKYKKELEEHINHLLKENLIIYLGGSKGSGYGKCRMRAVEKSMENYGEVKKALGIQSFEESDENKVIITCLSDSVFRNKFGQPVNHLPEEILYDLTQKVATLEKQFIKTGQTQGYNTTWRARYPKEATVKAGSVMSYRFSEKITSEDIHKLEEHLLGARTQDGYGWLGVNLYYPTALWISPKGDNSKKDPDDKNPDLDILLQKKSTKDTLKVLIGGMQEAKDRWLKMLYSQLFRDTSGNKDKELVISNELNNSQLKNMEDLIEGWRKSEKKKIDNRLDGKNKTLLERYYMADKKLFSLKEQEFKDIFQYLYGEVNKELKDWADEKLNTQKGRLFYFNHGEEEASRQFIADLLKTSLYIERMRRDRNE